MEQEKIEHPLNYPEEYITGIVNFFGREFRVTPAVLIPRLETEALIRRARTVLRQGKIRKVVDIGSWSGIIGTSVADLVDEVIFLDISPEALKIAQENFQKYYPSKSVEFLHSDLLSNIDPNVSELLFLANLPYIKAEDWGNMSLDTRFEPELALFWGEKTGFELYERLFQELREKKYQGTLIIEFGFDQREIAEWVLKKFGWRGTFFTDYAGMERFCEIYLTNN